MLALSAQEVENIEIMAYDHGGDLPDYYDFLAMVSRLVSPERRALLHAVAERDSFLNKIGHISVVSGLGRVYSSVDVELANLGAVLYEAATSTQFVGGDEAGTPGYFDPEGSAIAMATSLEIDQYSELGLMTLADTAAAILREEAPNLTELVGAVGVGIVGEAPTSDVGRRIVSGAALMRTLHITGQMRLYGEDPNWSA